MRDSLTLQEAADRLDVHYMTVYRYVRLGLLPARKEGGSWRVATSDLHSFQHAKGSDASGALSRKTAPWPARIEARLLEGDEPGVWSLVESALTSGSSPRDVYCSVLVPALRSIGDRWEQGRLTVADEHVASSVAMRIVARLGPRFARRGRRKGAVVLAGATGDRHHLGLSMVGDVLRGAGYDVIDLGPDTPADALSTVLARTEQLRAVGIGVSCDSSLDRVPAMVAAARLLVGARTLVLVGGGAVVDDGHARSLGADATASLESVADVVLSGRWDSPVPTR